MGTAASIRIYFNLGETPDFDVFWRILRRAKFFEFFEPKFAYKEGTASRSEDADGILEAESLVSQLAPGEHLIDTWLTAIDSPAVLPDILRRCYSPGGLAAEHVGVRLRGNVTIDIQREGSPTKAQVCRILRPANPDGLRAWIRMVQRGVKENESRTSDESYLLGSHHELWDSRPGKTRTQWEEAIEVKFTARPYGKPSDLELWLYLVNDVWVPRDSYHPNLTIECVRGNWFRLIEYLEILNQDPAVSECSVNVAEISPILEMWGILPRLWKLPKVQDGS